MTNKQCKRSTLRLFLDISGDDVIPRITEVTKLSFSVHVKEFQALSSCKNTKETN